METKISHPQYYFASFLLMCQPLLPKQWPSASPAIQTGSKLQEEGLPGAVNKALETNSSARAMAPFFPKCQDTAAEAMPVIKHSHCHKLACILHSHFTFKGHIHLKYVAGTLSSIVSPGCLPISAVSQSLCLQSYHWSGQTLTRQSDFLSSGWKDHR